VFFGFSAMFLKHWQGYCIHSVFWVIIAFGINPDIGCWFFNAILNGQDFNFSFLKDIELTGSNRFCLDWKQFLLFICR
jgi:hypothetical protein